MYHEAFEGSNIGVIEPDDDHQARVMNAIYGNKGVKAGPTDGVCREDLLIACAHLIERGAQVVILGCTELPLVLTQSHFSSVNEAQVPLLDPTAVLARKCVALARGL